MLTKEQTEGIVEAFKKEACDFLGIDSSSIQVKYTYLHQSMKGYFISNHEDTIIVDKQFLDKCISSKSMPPLRFDIYVKTKLIHERRSNKSEFNQNDHETIYKSTLYASAIMILKGLCLHITKSYNNKKLLDGIKSTLNTEFGFDGDFFKIPSKPDSKYNFYKFRLNFSSFQTDVCFDYPNKRSTVEKLSNNTKGGINNPFDNIYDAINYLKEIEKNAYETDKFMQGIASKKQYTYNPIQERFIATWAIPHVAHIENNYPEHSFVVNQMEPLNPNNANDYFFSLKSNLYKRKFLYRGQNDHYPDSPCVPNLYRDKAHNKKRDFLEFLIFSQELEILMKSHPLIQLLESGVVLLHDQFKIRMHYTGLAQHYYNKSNFLDLTSDIDVAKFFATTKYDCDKDKYSPFGESSKTGVIYYYELLLPEAFQSDPRKGYALKTIGKQIFMRSGAQSGFLLEMDLGVDFKEIPEVKAVYFKHDLKISEDIFKNSNDGADYFAEDILEHAWHDRMKKRFKTERKVSKKAVDEYNININNKKDTVASLTKRLKDMGIEVEDDYIPKFTDEELDIYYRSIKDGWWEKFCDDIYFQGGDGELYRDELKNVRNRPEYKWAFEKQ